MSPAFAPATDQSEVELPEPGRYIAQCVGIEDAPDKGFGPGVKWIFKLLDPQSGITIQSSRGGDYELWQFTSTKMGPKARARPIIEALYGRPLEKGEVPDARLMLGKSMTTVVIYDKKDDGSDKAVVTSCRPFTANDAPAAPPISNQAPPSRNGGGLLDQVQRAIRKAEVLGSPKHLDWLSTDLSSFSDGDLYQLLGEINADIAAA